MALQGYGLYRLNAIARPDRCIDLDQNSNNCFAQAQNNSGRQLSIFNPIDGVTWDIRFAGNAAAFLTQGDQFFSTLFHLSTKSGKKPATLWVTNEVNPGQYQIFTRASAIYRYFYRRYWLDNTTRCLMARFCGISSMWASRNRVLTINDAVGEFRNARIVLSWCISEQRSWGRFR